MLTDDQLALEAAFHAALADTTRLKILRLLETAPRRNQELAAVLGVTAPTICHHLERLLAAGMVRCERRGQSKFYSLASPRSWAPPERRLMPLAPSGAGRILPPSVRVPPAPRPQPTGLAIGTLYSQEEVLAVLGTLDGDPAERLAEMLRSGELKRTGEWFKVRRRA